MGWPDRLAARFTDWLASPAALIQGILVTLPWLAIVFLGFDKHGFWFLFFATLVSFITQFPLAYAARRAEQHSALLLRNLNDTMKLLVALADKIRADQESQEDILEEIQERIRDEIRSRAPLLGEAIRAAKEHLEE